MNHIRVERFSPCADTRTSTTTRTPGVALPTGNQNVCRPVMSARAVFLRSPASKCAMTVILAPGAVATLTPTLVPVRGCRWVTDAVPVSGAGGGEAVGVGVGEALVVAAVGAVWGPDEQPATASRIATAAPAAINPRACPQVRVFPLS